MSEGIKHSTNKPKYHTVITKHFPDALRMVVEIAMKSHFGKYAAVDQDWQNFKRVPNAIEEYSDAMMRHLLEDGDDCDALTHAGAAAWNALARLQLMIEAKEKTPVEEKPRIILIWDRNDLQWKQVPEEQAKEIEERNLYIINRDCFLFGGLGDKITDPPESFGEAMDIIMSAESRKPISQIISEWAEEEKKKHREKLASVSLPESKL